jgi:hypothetical protein
MAKLSKQKFNELGQKVAEAAQNGLDRSKRLAEIAKLRAANHSEEAAMKRAYLEIGKLYYAERGDAPEGAYVALCSRISKSRDLIQHNLNQINELKSVDEVSEDDFEDDVQYTEEDLADQEAQEEPQEEAAAPQEVPAGEAPQEDVVVEPAAEEVEDAPIPDEE